MKKRIKKKNLGFEAVEERAALTNLFPVDFDVTVEGQSAEYSSYGDDDTLPGGGDDDTVGGSGGDDTVGGGGG